MNKNILIFLFLFISTVTIAQTRIDTIFSSLDKGGALLVRLRTNEHAINSLKGKDDGLVERIIRERDEQNQEIMDAFNKEFAFCSVYFFYSSESKKIVNREFSGVLFDVDGNDVPDSVLLRNNYLIAQFGNAPKDTAKYWMDNYFVYREYDDNGEKKGRKERVDVYGSTSAFESSPDALFLLSPELYPLQKVKAGGYNLELLDGNVFVGRYPSSVVEFMIIPLITRSKERCVSILQNKLIEARDLSRSNVFN